VRLDLLEQPESLGRLVPRERLVQLALLDQPERLVQLALLDQPEVQVQPEKPVPLAQLEQLEKQDRPAVQDQRALKARPVQRAELALPDLKVRAEKCIL